ncbi:MAG: M42 family metallopeptidase [Candidatus Bathyarchaeota archaeon]|nr:M42 family metallopeptidase [Candidatus Bathyarchaeota archaeon]MDH5788947.1 M42 family metallopeptidase [Candidatus Bathyarchaeota archaeon]
MVDKKAINLLKEMLESFGPAGFERETATIVKKAVKAYADDVTVDKLGSVIFSHKGTSERPKILLAGHIDEVGFVVSGVDEKTGFLTFNPLGGWWDQVLLSQRVIVRTEKGDVHGVISAKPPHLLSPEEAKKVVEKKNMYIDIGATSKKETEQMGVKIGDPVVPYSLFSTIRNGKLAMGKAFDDRIGAFIAMEVVRRLAEGKVKHANTVYGAATVQEEVGLRGATTVAHVVDPDVAIALEVDISGDVPGVRAHEAPSRMGKGPTICTYDTSMIPNQALKQFVINTAKRLKIPFQLSIVSAGATDAGRIHISRAGCPSIVIGVPTRHIHSHVGILSLEDVENAIKLTLELVKRFDKKIVNGFTAF